MEEILRGQVASGEFGPVDLEVEVQRRLALLRAGATMGTIERARPSGQQLGYAAIRCPVVASSRGIPMSPRVIRPTSGCAKHRRWRQSEG